MTSKDDLLNQGDDVVERLKDAAERMLNGDIIGHNLSVFATDILTIINRAASPPVPDDVASAIALAEDGLRQKHRPPVAGLVVLGQETVKTLIRAASTPSVEVRALRDDIKTAIAQLHEGNKALAMRVLEEAINQPRTGGK